MTFKQFFADKGIDKSLAIAIATDGLGNKANTLAVTLSNPYKPSDFASLMIQGGDVHANAHITGIDPEKYSSDAYGLKGAEECLNNELLKDSSFLVSYSVRYFTGNHLIKTFPALFLGRTIVDVTTMCALRELGLEDKICAEAHNVDSFFNSAELEIMKHPRKSNKLIEWLDLYGLPSSELPLYQAQAINASTLFQHLTII